MNVVDLLRQVVRRRLELAQRREILVQLRMEDLVDALRASRDLFRCTLPRSFSDDAWRQGVRSKSATAFETSTWPPCAAPMIRAVRLIVLPK